ncbi:MAG: hypothetical protein EOO52_12875 [Gammaproteobacteria bacterium]|nr:MAG: hypothetical protein EOO52_12875 [Gammaproteobacteria bacterium]
MMKHWQIIIVVLAFVSCFASAEPPLIMQKESRTTYVLVLTIVGEHPFIKSLDTSFDDELECEKAGYKWQEKSRKSNVFGNSRTEFSFSCLKNTKG